MSRNPNIIVLAHGGHSGAQAQMSAAGSRRPSFAALLLWELRRMWLRRSTWLLLGLMFAIFFLDMVLLRENTFAWYFFNSPEPFKLSATGTSPWGMIVAVLQPMTFILGSVLPFVAAGAVAGDFKSRTHELLMATAIPTAMYVWLRYLAVLLLSLLLALLIPLATLTAGMLLHMLQGFPPPNVAALIAMWAIGVLPVIPLVSGVSFALGTALPRRDNIGKLLVLIAWFLCYLLSGQIQISPQESFLDPTARRMSIVLEREYWQKLSQEHQDTTAPDDMGTPDRTPWPRNPAEFQTLVGRVRIIEQTMPDLLPWLPGRLMLMVVGLAAVWASAATFRRFR